MADCSTEFLNFNNAISLTNTETKLLRSARRSITAKVKEYFHNNSQCPRVSFKGQGSFSMGTIIRPLNGDFDIDIGVYLQGQSNWRNEWPKPETVSYWLTNALISHTSFKPINKRNCIRIKYMPISADKEISYHVDLPIYCEYFNLLDIKYTRIGITGEKQWQQKSDPVGFTKWFNKRCCQNEKDKQQLIRLVKYVKAWKEFAKCENKLPSGMALTILMAANYVPNEREDLAFHKTVIKAYNETYGFCGSEKINSPVQPYNNILNRLTSNQKEKFKVLFGELMTGCAEAEKSTTKQSVISILQRHFGPRFQ